MAVIRANKLCNKGKVDMFLDMPQQMIVRHHMLNTDKLIVPIEDQADKYITRGTPASV